MPCGSGLDTNPLLGVPAPPRVLTGTCWTRACISCRASSSESLSAKTCSLFLPNYVQDKYLLQLLRSADDVSTWVAAEIVTSHTSKVGAQGSGPSTGSGVPVVRAPLCASPPAGGGGARRHPELKPLEQACMKGTQGRGPRGSPASTPPPMTKPDVHMPHQEPLQRLLSQVLSCLKP